MATSDPPPIPAAAKAAPEDDKAEGAAPPTSSLALALRSGDYGAGAAHPAAAAMRGSSPLPSSSGRDAGWLRSMLAAGGVGGWPTSGGGGASDGMLLLPDGVVGNTTVDAAVAPVFASEWRGRRSSPSPRPSAGRRRAAAGGSGSGGGDRGGGSGSGGSGSTPPASKTTDGEDNSSRKPCGHAASQPCSCNESAALASLTEWLGTVDVVTSARLLRRVLTLPFQPDAGLNITITRLAGSLMLHPGAPPLPPTMLLPDRPTGAPALPPPATLDVTAVAASTPSPSSSSPPRPQRSLPPAFPEPPLPTTAIAVGDDGSALTAPHEAAPLSLPLPPPPSPLSQVQAALLAAAVTPPRPHPPTTTLPPSASPLPGFKRVTLRRLGDSCALLGSDTPTYPLPPGMVAGGGAPQVSLHLREAAQPFTPADVVDLYLDNVLGGIPGAALCLHSGGRVTGYGVVPTLDLLSLSSPPVEPAEVERVAAALLQFLTTSCAADGGVYWLSKAPGDPTLRLHDVLPPPPPPGATTPSTMPPAHEAMYRYQLAALCLHHAQALAPRERAFATAAAAAATATSTSAAGAAPAPNPAAALSHVQSLRRSLLAQGATMAARAAVCLETAAAGEVGAPRPTRGGAGSGVTVRDVRALQVRIHWQRARCYAAAAQAVGAAAAGSAADEAAVSAASRGKASTSSRRHHKGKARRSAHADGGAGVPAPPPVPADADARLSAWNACARQLVEALALSRAAAERCHARHSDGGGGGGDSTSASEGEVSGSDGEGGGGGLPGACVCESHSRLCIALSAATMRVAGDLAAAHAANLPLALRVVADALAALPAWTTPPLQIARRLLTVAAADALGQAATVAAAGALGAAGAACCRVVSSPPLSALVTGAITTTTDDDSHRGAAGVVLSAGVGPSLLTRLRVAARGDSGAGVDVAHTLALAAVALYEAAVVDLRLPEHDGGGGGGGGVDGSGGGGWALPPAPAAHAPTLAPDASQQLPPDGYLFWGDDAVDYVACLRRLGSSLNTCGEAGMAALRGSTGAGGGGSSSDATANPALPVACFMRAAAAFDACGDTTNSCIAHCNAARGLQVIAHDECASTAAGVSGGGGGGSGGSGAADDAAIGVIVAATAAAAVDAGGSALESMPSRACCGCVTHVAAAARAWATALNVGGGAFTRACGISGDGSAAAVGMAGDTLASLLLVAGVDVSHAGSTGCDAGIGGCVGAVLATRLFQAAAAVAGRAGVPPRAAAAVYQRALHARRRCACPPGAATTCAAGKVAVAASLSAAAMYVSAPLHNSDLAASVLRDALVGACGGVAAPAAVDALLGFVALSPATGAGIAAATAACVAAACEAEYDTVCAVVRGALARAAAGTSADSAAAWRAAYAALLHDRRGATVVATLTALSKSQ